MGDLSQSQQKAALVVENFKVKVSALLVKGYRRFERRMILEHLSRHSSSSLGMRTGMLVHSLKMNGPQSFGNSIRIGASIGNRSVPYARIHETGGTVSAKPGKALAIPIGMAKTKAGVAKQLSPLNFPGLVMIKRAGRPPLLVRPRGKSGKAGSDLMFVLVKSVYIPPRLHFMDTWAEEAQVTKAEVIALAKATFGRAKR